MISLLKNDYYRLGKTILYPFLISIFIIMIILVKPQKYYSILNIGLPVIMTSVFILMDLLKMDFDTDWNRQCIVMPISKTIIILSKYIRGFIISILNIIWTLLPLFIFSRIFNIPPELINDLGFFIKLSIIMPIIVQSVLLISYLSFPEYNFFTGIVLFIGSMIAIILASIDSIWIIILVTIVFLVISLKYSINKYKSMDF